jgi:AmmeMemoRadiSam system protein B
MAVRHAAVAGSFYPADPCALADDVDRHLDEGRERLAAAGVSGPVKALIAPHAGYIYSGPIAGTAYAAVQGRRAAIDRVVILGPAHRVRVDGLAASSAEAFATPLGTVAVDRLAVRDTLRHAQVHMFDLAHAAEHSIEVQLPFLQRILKGKFEIIPFAVGAATHAEIAEVLDDLWNGEEVLVVVSSDLSHYEDYATASRLDAATAAAIEALHAERLGVDSACGRVPIGGLLVAAGRRGLQARRLDLRNSGDTAGGRDEVVGYGAFALA